MLPLEMVHVQIQVRPNKKTVFRVTQPYLKFTGGTKDFFMFFGKYIDLILCILKGISIKKTNRKQDVPTLPKIS